MQQCPYYPGVRIKRALRENRQENMLYRYNDQLKQTERNLTNICHSLRVKSFNYCSIVIETDTTVDSFEKVCDLTLRAIAATKSQGSETWVTGGGKIY